MSIEKEVSRRRTFAIISHPDAGKTTLTEKLLLYAGAIHIAGSVKSRKASRYATSDWMEIEKQRGISVASSVMQMEYRDCVINLLDTPGHKDFSEDTYRVLTAVDAALMVIDAANGIEPQTLRLLQVCRAQNTPVITFVNKMDREVREPLDLVDEIERTLEENKHSSASADHDLALELGRQALRQAPQAQALLLPGGLWHAIHAVPILEAEHGKPVLLNILSTTWAALHSAGSRMLHRPDPRWGRVLASL